MTKRRKLTAFLVVSWAAMAAVAPLCVAAQSEAGNADTSAERAKKIGGKFMCMCSCSQVLTQCNHVGCTVSTSMLKEVDQHLANGDSEAAITQGFVQEFGTQVYAEPPKSGLSLVAWSLPTVYLVLGTMIVGFVIWRWRARPGHAALQPHAAGGAPITVASEQLEQMRRRIAHDTED
jgi:cytochrome c-type biogenesis protein CcmH/NrfF